MERNRRVAKAYARSPVINIHGGANVVFDGDSIGLAAFENPWRDRETSLIHRMVGRTGFTVSADDDGNIILDYDGGQTISRTTRRPLPITSLSISIRDVDSVRSRGPVSIRQFGQRSGKVMSFPTKIFDMKLFLKYLNTELRRESLTSRDTIDRLQAQCVSVIGVETGSQNSSADLLDTPVWIMVVNIIALEMVNQNVNLSKYHHLVS